MPIPKQAPDPEDWLKATLRTQVEMQRDVLQILREADARIKATLRALDKRASLGTGEMVRQAQLRMVQRNLRLEMAKVWRELGDAVEARRAEAAARAIKVGQDLNTYLLGRVGGLTDAETIAANIAAAEEAAAASGLDRMIARVQGQSYQPLSQTVYNSSVVINGQVDRLINTALARGLSARELADEVSSFINPNTPGGVRYASMRLARTEINNAAHAVAVHQVQDSPWVTGMEWHLSGSHPRVDICDTLAKGGPKNDGVYAKDSVPAKPHPQCFCYVTPVAEDEEDFLDNLVGGKYDDYMKRYIDTPPETEIKPPTLTPKKTATATPKKATPKTRPPKASTTQIPPGRTVEGMSAEAANRARYGNLLRIKPGIPPENFDMMMKSMNLIPGKIQEELVRYFKGKPEGGYYIGPGSVTDSDSAYFKSLKGVRPRGHAAGSTWSDIEGAHSPAQRQVAMGFFQKWGTLDRSQEIVIHESGHAVDVAFGHLSTKPGFLGPMRAIGNEVDLNPYFMELGNPSGFGSEGFAQCFWSWTRSRTLTETERIMDMARVLGMGTTDRASLLTYLTHDVVSGSLSANQLFVLKSRFRGILSFMDKELA